MTPRQKLTAKIGAGALALVVPLVVTYEGLVLRGYRDPVNIVTACVGHTATAQMRPYTREECEALLYRDLAQHADALDCVKVPLSDAQKAALLSFAFNVGAANFCKSTLVRKANAGDMPGACAELSRWVLAGGRELPGLVKRRAAERALCERGLA
jgi:lysozyme